MSLNAAIPSGGWGQGRCFSRCPRCIVYSMWSLQSPPCPARRPGSALHRAGRALGPVIHSSTATREAWSSQTLHPRPGSPTACGRKAMCLFGINHSWSHFNNAIQPFKVGRILTELRLQIILLKYYIMTSMVKLFILIFIISKKSYHHIIPVVLV